MDNKTLKYTAEEFTRTIDAADYIARFRDVARFGECCRKCPAYGATWGCPPFDYDTTAMLRGFTKAELTAVRITPSESSLPIGASQELIQPERRRLEALMLEKERATGGRAFSYVGTCLHCPPGTCTRPEGKPCRHPELVRPSLESFGFDLSRTASEIFGMPMLWGRNGLMPPYFILICGVFY